MELINIINSVADSNTAYYVLIGILLVVVIAMIYLIYAQNKEIKRNRDLEEERDFEEVPDTIEEIANDISEEEKKDEEETYELPARKPVFEPLEEKVEVNDMFEENKVKKVEEIELPREKKLELIDATLTNLPNLSLLEETMTAIPPVLDYAEETQELVNITKELENAPKERTVELTPYEEEQEKTAIISYDELMDSKDGIVYENEEISDDIPIKKVDLEKTVEISLDEIDKKAKEEIEETNNNYDYEEDFLSKLKKLQKELN